MIRRDVLKLGGTLAVAMAAPASLQASNRSQNLVVADVRFETASVFAAAAAQDANTRVFAMKGDLASLWHGEMSGESLAGLKGLTSYADMLIAAGLAADARTGFSLRIAHGNSRGAPSHRLVNGLQNQVRILEVAGTLWPAALWTVMVSQSEALPKTAKRRAVGNGREGALWSWVIA